MAGILKVKYFCVVPTFCNFHSPGIQCRKLLDLLEIPDGFSEFYDTLKAVKELHKMCNKQLLPHDYQEVIDKFRSAWYNLTEEWDISTTPKIHILLDHLEDYFDLTNMTLIKVTDELCENMHQFVSKRLMKSFYYVKDVSNPNHGPRLFRAIMHLNS